MRPAWPRPSEGRTRAWSGVERLHSGYQSLASLMRLNTAAATGRLSLALDTASPCLAQREEVEDIFVVEAKIFFPLSVRLLNLSVECKP
jgi:hypothetical protein